MTEVSDADKRDAPAAVEMDASGRGSVRVARPVIVALAVCVVSGGLFAIRNIARPGASRPAGERLLPAVAKVSINKVDARYGPSSPQIKELEALLGASGAEVSTPQ